MKQGDKFISDYQAKYERRNRIQELWRIMTWPIFQDYHKYYVNYEQSQEIIKGEVN